MPQRNRVVVVSWEGADWDVLHPLIDSGQMPYFESVVDEGTIGELATLQPQLDPLLAASLATGCRGDRHGVLDHFTVDGDIARPTLSHDRKSPAVWNLLNRHGLRTHVVGFPTYPAEAIDGTFVSHLLTCHGDATIDFRSLPRAVYPSDIAAVLDPLRVLPTELTPAELLPFVPRAAEVDQASDPGLAIIASWLAEWVTKHNMATHLLERDDWDFAWVHYDAIDRFGHAFMRFHPPRMPGIRQRSFGLYQHVMSMVYRFADMQLGRLVELAGEGTTVIVCSPHGFRSGADRPKPTHQKRNDVSWHRSLGVLAMRGPAIGRDQWFWGGTLLDLCPTILRLFGLPVGDSLDGRPLEEALIAEPLPRGATQHPTPKASNSAAALRDAETEIVIRWLVDDDYLEPDAARAPNVVQRTIDARAFNLAHIYLDAGRVAKAVELLESLVARRPEVGRFALQLAYCRLALGDFTGCGDLIERVKQLDVPNVYARRLQAELHFAKGDFERALDELFDLEQAYPDLPDIHRQIGDVYLATQRWDEASRAFQKELARDADDPAALFGLGRIAEAAADYERASNYYLRRGHQPI